MCIAQRFAVKTGQSKLAYSDRSSCIGKPLESLLKVLKPREPQLNLVSASWRGTNSLRACQ